jgi:hypothetical protein
MASGDYDLRLWNMPKTGPVVITPAAGAVVTAVAIAAGGSSFLQFVGPIHVNPTGVNPFQYGIDVEGGGHDIVIDGAIIRGPDCAALKGVGAWFRSLPPGSSVTIKNATFTCLGSGLGALDVDGLTIDHNAIDTVQTDGMILTGVVNVVISNNTGTNWNNAGGGHPDFIQFASSAATATAHVKIIGNTYNRGPATQAQNIFIEDGSDFLIQGNASFGAAYYGWAWRALTDSDGLQQLRPATDRRPASYDLIRQQAARVQFIAEAVSGIAVGVPNEVQPTAVTVNGVSVGASPATVPGTPAIAPAAPGDLTQFNKWKAAPNPCPGDATSPAPPPVVTPPPLTSPPEVQDPLQPALDAATAQITTLTNKLQVEDASLTAAQGQVTTLTASIASLKTQLAAAQTSASTSQVKSLQTQLSVASAWIANVRKATAAKSTP